MEEPIEPEKGVVACDLKSEIANHLSAPLLCLINNILSIDGVLKFSKEYVNSLLYKILVYKLDVSPSLLLFGLISKQGVMQIQNTSVALGSESSTQLRGNEKSRMSRKGRRAEQLGHP